jgi:adenine/guanine phosphoribosyltransferase-like PRPP-binding protein
VTRLVEKLGGNVVGLSFVVEQEFLKADAWTINMPKRLQG